MYSCFSIHLQCVACSSGMQWHPGTVPGRHKGDREPFQRTCVEIGDTIDSMHHVRALTGSKLRIEAKQLNLGFIRRGNHVSHSLSPLGAYICLWLRRGFCLGASITQFTFCLQYMLNLSLFLRSACVGQHLTELVHSLHTDRGHQHCGSHRHVPQHHPAPQP